jgi:fructose-specific component phosphotransferase system IIB-like protein
MAANAAAGKADASLVESIKKDMEFSVSVVNCHLLPSAYMVGDKVTIADISLVIALQDAAGANLFDPSSDDEKTTHIRKWYNAITTADFFKQAKALLSTSVVSAAAESSSSASNDGVTMHGVAPAVKNKLYKRHRIRIKEVLNNPTYVGKTVTVAGWTRTVRKAGGKLLLTMVHAVLLFNACVKQAQLKVLRMRKSLEEPGLPSSSPVLLLKVLQTVKQLSSK